MIEFTALLLVATLFGGMMLYSFGFAPIVFSTLPAKDASRFIRAAFPWYYLFVIVTACWWLDLVAIASPVERAVVRDRHWRRLCAPSADTSDQRCT